MIASSYLLKYSFTVHLKKCMVLLMKNCINDFLDLSLQNDYKNYNKRILEELIN